MGLREDQIRRYARHILLRDVGGIGQEKLLKARVLVIGAGGLGAPLGLYLAAAGVGVIGMVDDDVVDETNLQRQIIHSTATLGEPKVLSAAKTMRAINPDVDVVPHQLRIGPENASELMADHDIVVDGSDNFETRFLINDAAFFAGKPVVSGAILRFDGQVATFKGHEPEADKPCYRCLFRGPPPPGQIPTCAEAGVLGALCGMVGSIQAMEVIKEIIGIGEGLAGKLMVIDGLSMEVRKLAVAKDPGCPLCGTERTIADPSPHRRTTGRERAL